jgi:hypothetical protein
MQRIFERKWRQQIATVHRGIKVQLNPQPLARTRFPKRPQVAPAPANAVDAVGSLRESDPRTSGKLQSALRWL